MEKERHLGFEIKAVSNLIDRKIGNVFLKNGVEDITPTHGMIMGFLMKRGDSETYQRDIETQFDITRSTVTAVLKLMEKKGYITRQGVPQDGRLKRIRLTDHGRDSFRRLHSSIDQVESVIKKDITKEEELQILLILDKIKAAVEIQ